MTKNHTGLRNSRYRTYKMGDLIKNQCTTKVRMGWVVVMDSQYSILVNGRSCHIKKLLPPSSGSIAFNWHESNNAPNVDGSTGDVAEAKEKKLTSTKDEYSTKRLILGCIYSGWVIWRKCSKEHMWFTLSAKKKRKWLYVACIFCQASYYGTCEYACKWDD